MAIELVVGLGNPGSEYAASRHNVGFRVVDELARRHPAARWRRRLGSTAAVAAAARHLTLAKPVTYMNRSGRAVVRLLHRHRLEPSQLLVVVDDVDLPLGSLRLRARGGPGTHNGLRDICSLIGEGFPRLRVGVRGEQPWQDLAEYVLAPFTPTEEELVADMVRRAADAVQTAVTGGVERAMSDFNRRAEEPDAT